MKEDTEMSENTPEAKYKTRVIKCDRNNLSDEAFGYAAELLRGGELVAFPTETVYGLGGNAQDEEASRKIYAAKGRPSDNPLIVHIADIDDLEKVGREVPEQARKLAEKFWPGPLTIIVKRSDLIPKTTTGGLDTVAVRFPSDEIAQRLIKESGLWIAAPSANASGRPSTTRAEHCLEDLDGRIPLILDGGPVKIGLESTIVDCTNEVSDGRGGTRLQAMILRPGYITLEQIRELDPFAEYDPAVTAVHKDENIVAKAPGMKYRHYAPRGEFTVFAGEPEKVIERINACAGEKLRAGKKVCIMATEESKDNYDPEITLSLGRRSDEADIAAHLFDTLRRFDELGAEYIYGESFEYAGVGQAIMNRLLNAAGYNIVKV